MFLGLTVSNWSFLFPSGLSKELKRPGIVFFNKRLVCCLWYQRTKLRTLYMHKMIPFTILFIVSLVSINLARGYANTTLEYDLIKKEGQGKFMAAQYNSTWMLPPFRKNEILVQIK